MHATSSTASSDASRLKFETLIVDTSATLMSASPSKVHQVVEAALDGVRVFFGGDRCGLLRVHDEQNLIEITHEAYGPGVPKVPAGLNMKVLFPWSYAQLREGRAVQVDRLESLPHAAATDRDTWTRLGARANLTVPVTQEGRLTYLISLGVLSHERTWPDEYVPRIRVLGEMLVAAVTRADRELALDAANRELKALRERLERENVYLQTQVDSHKSADLITGRSAAMQRVLTLAAQVAATDTTVLITGETGTGKERVASFVHGQSDRRARPMVRVNCSAIPVALIESELFGREKGAYTGALTRQVGRFELAHGSTLFLDEIGDLPLDVQVKLLRVLQERTIERLGSPTPIHVDVRIIAATNHDLEAAVRAGRFRSDLLYRLNVFPIVVPPLRDRREDIPGLVDQLLSELTPSVRKHFARLERGSLDALAQYNWPGNVRELRNVLERAMILSHGSTLKVDLPTASRPEMLPVAPIANTPPPGGLREWERDHIVRVLGDTGWRIRGTGGAASVLNLKPTTLEKRMARLGIRRPSAGA